MPDTAATERPDTTVPALEPLPPQLTTIQPGGGTVMRLELAWGHMRRAWLRVVGQQYVERMRKTRKGEHNPTPHEVLDPRDVKFYVNQPGGYRWDEKDDPHAWRGRLPFARWGLAELIVFTAVGTTVTLGLFGPGYAASNLPPLLRGVLLLLSLAAAIVTGLLIWFFRDPHRVVPPGAGLIVSPADGTVSEVAELDHHAFVGGPAVRVSIFLSIFNVHVNRWPIAGRVVGLDYKPGKYLDARNPLSALENEQLHIRLESTDAADGPPRRIVMHLVAGLIARRIVCVLKPGDVLNRGDRIGMIKLGSRTEIVLPKEPGLTIRVIVGDRVHGASTLIAEYGGVASSK